MPKNSAGEFFTVAIILGIEKVWIREGGVSKFSVENFLSHSAEKFRRGIFYCCNNFGYRKSLDKRGGASRFSVENFLSHSAENFRRGIFYCCNNFGYRKSLKKRGGEHQVFPSKIFCHTVPKISVGEFFTVAIISDIEKVWIREGGVSRFSVENFLSHSAEKFRRGILYCCNNFGYRESLDRRRGSIKVFRRKFFVSQCRKIPQGNFLLLQ